MKVSEAKKKLYPFMSRSTTSAGSQTIFVVCGACMAWKLPKKERAKMRSKTFEGIARAMAEQWAG